MRSTPDRKEADTEIVQEAHKRLAEGHGKPPPFIDCSGSFAKKAYLPAKDSAALAAKAFDFFGMDSITFISCQSYGNSLPQLKHETYVPVSCAAGESRWPGRLVIGKLKFLWLQPKRTSSRLAIIHHPQNSGLPWKRLTCRLRH